MFTAILLVAVVCWAEARTWTDTTGKFKMEATLVRVDAGNAVLKKSDGNELTVPVAKLCEADQKFLLSLAAPVAAPPTDGLLESIEKQAATLRTASDAVLLYTKLLSNASFAGLHPQLEARRKHWESLVSSKSLRMGDKWMSLDDAKKLEQSEKQLLDEADRMIEVNNVPLAGERLRKASQANPQSIRADFTAGLVLSLALRQPAEAQKYFTTCVQRKQKYTAVLSNAERANLVASLNNFAIVKVRQSEYRAGLVAWRQALDLAAPSKELIQNLGKLGALSQTHPHLRIPAGIAREASELYSKVAVASAASKYKPDMGWLYMRQVDEPTAEQIANAESTPAKIIEKPKPAVREKPEDLILLGSGSGFVIAPNYVVTNHHVVKGGDAVTIITTSSPDKHIEASVVSMISEPDLALVACKALDAPAVRVRVELPKLGADLALIGFPRTDVLGTGLKATRGTLSGLPDPKARNLLLYDAVNNAGNSGGPVCDKFGNVVAVNCLVYHFGSFTADHIAGGIPSSQLVAFLSSTTVKASPPIDSKDLTWEDVIEAVGKSTVQVLVYQQASKVKLAKRESKSRVSESWDAYEDGWCMTCHGTSIADCPAYGCGNGKIRSQAEERIGTTANGTAITKRASSFKQCSTCSGRGKVDCPYCDNGIEHQVDR